MAFYEEKVNGVTLLNSSIIPVAHGFTTRLGGVSVGTFASMNLGENRGDTPACVSKNYELACGAIGVEAQKLVFTRQVHGNHVKRVTGADSRELFSPIDYDCDGLVTAERGLPILCFTADCVPVLLCDVENGVVAAVHCGWRSSVQDILGVAVSEMRALGADVARIRAAIGPAIGACCFEVEADVCISLCAWLCADAEEFIREKPNVAGKFLVDLRGANRKRLLNLGLSAENIDVTTACTMCEPEKFWSHRATKGVRGNMAAIISL